MGKKGMVFAGRTRLVARINVRVGRGRDVSGFIAFANIDRVGQPFSYGVNIHAARAEDIALQGKLRI